MKCYGLGRETNYLLNMKIMLYGMKCAIVKVK
nr:MAG TPA: hypothetical protein [Caudoviricetes sp.]